MNKLIAGAAPARPGADSALIPTGVTKIAICRYVAGYLEQSTSMSGAAAANVAHVLNSAPTGSLIASVGTYSKKICRDPKAGLGEANGLTYDDAEAYRLEADYATGSPVVVVARFGWCGDLGESNGTRYWKRTSGITSLLTELVGNSLGWPGSVSPAK